MKKVPINTTKKGNPTPKPQAGGSSKVPVKPRSKSPIAAQPTVPVRDVYAERRPDSASECSVEKPTTATDPGAVVLMEELVQRFGSEEEAMKVFAIFSSMREKEKPTETTTAAPPETTIPEDTTARSPISHTEEPQVSIGTLAQDQPHAEEGGEQTDDGGLAEGLERMAMDEQRRTEKEVVGKKPVSGEEVEGETLEGGNPVTGSKYGEGETPVSDDGEKGETSVFDDVGEGETPIGKNLEGETPVESDGGETPVHGSLEGETPKNSEGVTPVVFAEGETPGHKNSEGETPNVFEEGEAPVNTEVQEPEGGGLTEFVDLVNEPEDDDTPIKRREARRMARRSLLDEVEDLAQHRRLEFLALGAEVEQEEEAPGSGDELEEAEERRFAAERKRKGKHAATIPPKRSRKTASVKYVEAPLPAPTKVPYAKEPVGPSPDSETEDDEEEEQEEELNYERTEVWVTKKLLEAMGQFDDQKMA